jgi:hypothetical protein
MHGRLAEVFRADAEPFVDPHPAPPARRNRDRRPACLVGPTPRDWLEDIDGFGDTVNPANLQLQAIAVRVKYGVRDGLVGQFDPITLELALGALNGAATACERIKQTPTPRQYDYFTRLAVAAFSTLLPFGLLGALHSTDAW